jgi:hypothetical protein
MKVWCREGEARSAPALRAVIVTALSARMSGRPSGLPDTADLEGPHYNKAEAR